MILPFLPLFVKFGFQATFYIDKQESQYVATMVPVPCVRSAYHHTLLQDGTEVVGDVS